MNTLIYRGYQVAANDNVKAAPVRKGLVYRGAKNDNTDTKNQNTKTSTLRYRGAVA